MVRHLATMAFLAVSIVSTAQLSYTISYKDSSLGTLRIAIEPRDDLAAPVSFVMPRSVPGHYSGSATYDKFISNIYAVDYKGEKMAMRKDLNDAPRWYFNDAGKLMHRIEYEVDLRKMESTLTPADASIIRSGFVGILNYSVFGWIDGTEKQPLQCTVETFGQWPIFTTIQPSAATTKGSLKFRAENYYELADAQTFMGPAIRVKEFQGIVPLFVASYCETEDDNL